MIMKTIDIQGYENLYQITDTGVVIALKKVVQMPKGGVKTIKTHYPKIMKTKKGYLKVMLTNCCGMRKGHYVHRLVAENFMGKNKLTVNHINQNKTDNNLSNLEFMARKDNFIYSIDKTKTSSKYIGVTKKGGKWQVVKNKKYIGVYVSEELAHKAYVEAK